VTSAVSARTTALEQRRKRDLTPKSPSYPHAHRSQCSG
jgi:hypothetical protein